MITNHYQGSRPKPYETQINDETGLLSCDCPGWTIKREGKPRHCKHTQAEEKRLNLTLVERDGQMFVVDGFTNMPCEPVTVAAPSAPSSTTRGFIEPMLASKMPDGKTVEDFDRTQWVMEEKYDGHRIVVAVTEGGVRAWSRLNNARTLPSHIVTALRGMPDGTYDAELIVPGNKSYGVTAGQNSGREVLVLFDAMELLGQKITSTTQSMRRLMLEQAYKAILGSTAVALSTQITPSTAFVEDVWSRGGEGAMLKRLGATYHPGVRSPDWIKVKAVAAATVTITGYMAGKSGPYSAVAIRDDEGNVSSVKTINNKTLREMQAAPDSFIGKRLVVSYQERTPNGSYRHLMWDHLAGEAE